MNRFKAPLRALFIAAALVAGQASAALVTVLPTDPLWANPASENGGGGSSAITGAMPRAAGETGSLELTGDRTRFFGLGNPYSAASNLGLLSQVTRFAFDWMVAVGSSSSLHPDYTPALRLHIWDGSQRSELIWEGAYNGVYGAMNQGTWYTSAADAVFWRFQTGLGQTNQPVGGAMALFTIGDWAAGSSNNGTAWYTENAYVAAISVGVGGSAGGGYRAFADNVVFNIGGNDRTFNFELRDTGTVPVPGTLALIGLGLVAAGVARRRA